MKKAFPTLYHRSKGGATVQWDIWTDGPRIFTRYGQVGGQLQTTPGKLAEAKNTGKANATTAIEQAEQEAIAMHKHKLDRKYSLTPAEAQESKYLPMLAHDFKKEKKLIQYPVMVQPKLDGYRCLAFKEDGVVTLYSRSGDVFDLPHISKELEALPDGAVLDGELYCHGVPFQKVASWIKKHHVETARIGYHVYDVPEMGGRADLPMKDRLLLLNTLGEYKWKSIDVVETIWAKDAGECFAAQLQFIQQGYEGAIVRLSSGLYRYDYRSHDLLKLKNFEDMECVVVGGNHGTGKMSNQCIFTCRTKEGREFDVVPVGTAHEREQYLVNLKQYIGKEMKVKYFGKSENGTPRFPVGLGFRPGWDK